ncbi:MAG: nicotinate phosphoribosyltransferase [Massilia sp.]
MPIVRSLLETDLYKFTMWQALLHRHPATQTEYAFLCRNAPAYPLAELKDEVEAELDHLCTLTFTEDEVAYVRGLRFIKDDFADFLTVFRFQRKFIDVTTEGEHLCIKVHGPLVHVMGFEIFVLYIVNELYYRRFDHAALLAEARRRLEVKIGQLEDFAREPQERNPFEFFDFGVRRRFSGDWQEEVVATLAQRLPGQFKGTSNVYLAMKYKLIPIGTMAHEYMQAFQSFAVRLRDFQSAALEDWVQEYRGDLGTALTDTVGMDAFLRDFDLYFAKLFDGLRHDSGDPVEWGEKALAHYAKLRIDAQTKRLVFSDSLDLQKAFMLYRHFAARTQTGFGIGTNLSNDTGIAPLNLVMKLVASNGQPVAKLSDSPGKTMATDHTFLAYLAQVFGRPAP